MKILHDNFFKPFKKVDDFCYVLYACDDGTYNTERPEGDDFKIWRIIECQCGWLITLGEDYWISECYIGNIPTREFFIELMKNVVNGFDIEMV